MAVPQAVAAVPEAVRRFFELILDMDSAGRDRQRQAAQNYLHDMPKDPDLFRFHPSTLSFEPVEAGRCSPVLYSAGVVDYSLPSCVEGGFLTEISTPGASGPKR